MKKVSLMGSMRALWLRWMFILAVLFSANANAAVVKMLLMGDTQYILNTSPTYGDWKIFTNAMYKVTRDSVTSNAMFLASMGDITENGRDNNIPLSYDHAKTGFNLLNGRMPYILNFGNNDTTTDYNRVFPLSNFSGKPEFVANKDSYINHAEKFSSGGVDWLVISIKRFPDAALVSWAEGLINANPSKKVIIVNHTQGLGDGDIVWNMAKKKANVVFMFLGHNTVMHELLTANDGHKVGRIQTCWHNKNNDHYLCKVEADTVTGSVNCSYYSPVNKNYKDVNNANYKWSWSGFKFGGSTSQTTVPWVTNLTQAAAGTSITNAGLVVSGVNAEYHATVPAGKIFSQTPGGGTSVARGSSVALAVSLGPANTTTVPWVTNLTQAAAGTAITNAGLIVGGVNSEYHATVAAGRIFSQTPGGGITVTRGTAVNLAVSLGPVSTTTTVPWVTNLTQAAAGTAITNAGLVVSGVSREYHPTVAAGKIFSQTPGGGVVTNRGSSVALAASLGPQPQLVLNNSFEVNTASWVLKGSSIRSTTTAANGIASLRMNMANSSATQKVAIVSGKTYDISTYVYVAARSSGMVVFDTWDKYDAAGQGQFTFSATNGGWKKYSGSFTATNTSVTLRMFSDSSFVGTAYFDQIELKPRN